MEFSSFSTRSVTALRMNPTLPPKNLSPCNIDYSNCTTKQQPCTIN